MGTAYFVVSLFGWVLCECGMRICKNTVAGTSLKLARVRVCEVLVNDFNYSQLLIFHSIYDLPEITCDDNESLDSGEVLDKRNIPIYLWLLFPTI